MAVWENVILAAETAAAQVSPEVERAVFFSILASALCKVGECERAILCLKEGFDRVSGMEAIETAAALTTLAFSSFECNQEEFGKKICDQAIDALSAFDQLQGAAIKARLAAACFKLGDSASAENLIGQVLQVSRKAPKAVSNILLQQVTLSYFQMGNLRLAAQMLEGEPEVFLESIQLVSLSHIGNRLAADFDLKSAWLLESYSHLSIVASSLFLCFALRKEPAKAELILKKLKGFEEGEIWERDVEVPSIYGLALTYFFPGDRLPSKVIQRLNQSKQMFTPVGLEHYLRFLTRLKFEKDAKDLAYHNFPLGRGIQILVSQLVMDKEVDLASKFVTESPAECKPQLFFQFCLEMINHGQNFVLGRNLDRVIGTAF